MPRAGDSFIVTLGPTHVDWGNVPRNTTNRNRINGENYIPIPSAAARSYNIYNSNAGSGLGVNEFNAVSVDGNFSGVVKTSGNNVAGDKYAKNLHVSGDLKGFGQWFQIMNVQVGTNIEVRWTSPTSLTLRII